MPQLPSHDELADLLLSLGALQAPAELHGYLTGQLAVGARLDTGDWQAQVVEFLDCERPDPEQCELLQELVDGTVAELREGQMALSLLMPDDSLDLSQRVESLGWWCQGFLAGFALAAKARQDATDAQAFSADIGEALNDLVAISQVGIDSGETEEAEAQFFEVCEYVRMAALTVYLECHAPAAGSKPDILTPPTGGRLH